MHRCASDSRVRVVDFREVNADPHLRCISVQPAVVRKPALNDARALDRIGGPVERDEEAVAGVARTTALPFDICR
jgi:hypothetical protein